MDEVASGSRPVAPEMQSRTRGPLDCPVYSALSNDALASDEVSIRHPKVTARITVFLRAETQSQGSHSSPAAGRRQRTPMRRCTSPTLARPIVQRCCAAARSAPELVSEMHVIRVHCVAGTVCILI